MKKLLLGRWLLIELLALLTLGAPAVAQAQTSTITTTTCPILTGGVAAGAGCVVQNTTSTGTVSIQIENAFTGTISFKISNDMANWAALDVYKTTAPTTAVSTTTTTGLYIAPVFGAKYVLVGFTAFTSGTAAITMSTAMANPVALMARSIGSGATIAAAASGTCVTPSHTFTGDLDTGVGYLGANNAALCAGGATSLSWSTTAVTSALPIQAPSNTAGTSSSFRFNTTAGLTHTAGDDSVIVQANNTYGIKLGGTGTGLVLASTSPISWITSSGSGDVFSGGSADLFLYHDAANTLACRNGTNPCTLRVYNTFTDASNYVRFNILSDANNFYLSSSNAGTGSARGIMFQTSGSNNWNINASGHFLSSTDNAIDIGASGANRPRTGYFGTSVISAGTTLSANALAFANGNDTITSSNNIDLTVASGNYVGINDGGSTNVRLLATGIKLSGVSMVSTTAPTIASGGCTSPAVTWSNGTAAFKLTIGSSCSGVKTITLTMPAATNQWVCQAQDQTTPASFLVTSNGTSTTAVVLSNYSHTTGLAIDFVAGEVLAVSCIGG